MDSSARSSSSETEAVSTPRHAPPFVGIQLDPESVCSEGAEHVCKVLARTARVNALFVNTHAYHDYGLHRQTAEAPEHGAPAPRPSHHTNLWVKVHDEHYRATPLKHRADPKGDYLGTDIIETLTEPAAANGQTIFARILEPWGSVMEDLIPGANEAMALDSGGGYLGVPCWNKPAYRDWLFATVTDLFKTYPVLAGFMFASERSGSLMAIALQKSRAHCFCEFCCRKMRERGVNADAAREGFRQMEAILGEVARGGTRPPDGVFVSMLRLLVKYPALLAWEKGWWDARDEVCAEMRARIKAIRPDAQVGWHIYHNAVSQNLWDRALLDYEALAGFSDFIKPVVYQHCAAPRLKGAVDAQQKTILADFVPDEAARFLYGVFGYSGESFPPYADLLKIGFGPQYVKREIERCARAVRGRCRIYAGIGFDVPVAKEMPRETPENIEASVAAAFSAGADGLILSREYCEMRLENLEAAGRAVGRL